MVPFSGEVRSYVYSTGNFPVALTWQIIQPLSLISCVWLSTIFSYCRALSRFSFYRRLSRTVFLNSVSIDDSIENWKSIRISLYTDSLSSHFLFSLFFFYLLLYQRVPRVFLVHFSCESDAQLLTCVFLDENRDDNLFVHIYYKQILETDNDMTVQ